jgi:glutathione-regulated potassium-efflux system ancillary protein KefG
MKKILILFAHPALQRSLTNREVIKVFENIENVTFHDLYESYPQMDIDVEEEQELLINHDTIVFMFPMFWYSTPAILKEWQDLVLEHDWAYGSKGNMLKDKIFFSILTTGGKVEAYKKEGYNGYTIREFLRPLEQMSKLCKMRYLPPYAVSGTHSITSEMLENHKTNIRKLISGLMEETLNIESAIKFDLLNDFIDSQKG